MRKVLGLDLGTSSIGWAVVDEENESVLGMGTRIFPEGVVNLGDGDNEISKNAARTQARGIRRQIFRRKLRKALLLRTLAENGLCPIEKNSINGWNTNTIAESSKFRNWVSRNPYELRAKAVSQKICLHDIGRIFYHMIQRRGFQSNSRNAGDEDGAIFTGNLKEGKTGINETKEQLNGKTLGEYLHELYPEDREPFTGNIERIRNRYTTRQMYVEEFEKIWEEQKKYHPVLTDKFKEVIGGRKKDGYKTDGILFYQRPLRTQKFLVGKCTFEPGKPKCPRSAIPFELFRIYQWVNSVECNGQKISSEDRAVLVDQLQKKEKVQFSSLRRSIGKGGSEFQFNYKDDDKIYGSHTISKLRNKKIFGSRWDELSEEDKEQIWHDLFFYDDKNMLRERGMRRWGLGEAEADEFSKFRLADGYANLSRKAISNILPFLKEGFTYETAVALGGIKNAFGSDWETLGVEDKTLISDNIWDIMHQGNRGGYISDLRSFLSREFGLGEKHMKKLYHHSTSIEQKQKLRRLPLGMDADREIRSIRNPVVITALFELRRIVNELFDIFGEFNSIKIELARDLKVSKQKRNEIRNEQKRLERENDRVKKELERLGQEITHVNLLKYKLWEECNKTCPFTGRTIEVHQLFTGNVQIEHIHPWSRSLNDSFMNKTLCFADENRAKGNRTPYEFYFKEQGEQKWELLKSQALSCFKNKPNYPKAYLKFKQFIKKKHEDDFASRQLNDTRYISREAKAYLAKISDNITVAPGQMTSNLRSKWGLNSILSLEDEKTREDHRHHAIDALVMACMKKSYLDELSRWNRYNRQFDLKDFPLPWAGFRAQAEGHVNSILVSHKKTSNVLSSRAYKVKKIGRLFRNKGVAARGALHKETVFGKRKSQAGMEAFHVRKPLESITTKKQVEKIADPSIRSLIHARVALLGGYINEKNVPAEAFFGTDDEGRKLPRIFLPNRHGDPVPVRKVRIRENLGGAERLKDFNQYVNPRNNHHVLVYKDHKGDLKEDVVTFWTAVQRKKQGQPVVQLPQDGQEIVATLQINDMFVIGLSDEQFSDYVSNHLEIGKYLFRVQKLSEGYYTFRFHTASTLKHTEQELRIQSFKKWTGFNPIPVNISSSGVLTTK